MLNLKVGGVPEHFNYPWYITLKDKEYTKNRINLRWQDFPGGTGDMCKALRSGEIDIAIVLTEGIIKDIIDGNPSKIIQFYVESPLIWGIHVSAKSKYQDISELQNATIAISRYGSGSHLMAIVNAHNNGWDIKKLKFKVVNNLEGGINALNVGEADYFMWEHFTTKPYVDEGIFKSLGNCPTPWPCFVVAVREEILKNHSKDLKKVLDIINNCTKKFKQIDKIDQTLSLRYQQQLNDVREWLSITEWGDETPVSEDFITDIQNKMKAYNVIDKTVDSHSLIKNMYI
ncbi:MAG TPA: ABC transporter substrate-binding protein [Tenacibaculum sp.]|nr:ABC transporter substrate-binding protein [Tenacibaculum sp.]